MKARWISFGLSILGVGGVAVTSWLSVKCHEKAKTKETKREKRKCYIPAIFSGIATGGCILLAHGLSMKEIADCRKEIAALTAGCGYLAANRDKIEQKIREKLGQEDLKQIRQETAKELRNERPDAVIVEDTGYGKTHFVENYFGREFYCSLEHVKWAESMLNAMFLRGETVNMNTFYELLGLKKTRAGFEFGWPEEADDAFGYSMDEPIHFENIYGEDEDGHVFYMIDIRSTPPLNCYLEL